MLESIYKVYVVIMINTKRLSKVKNSNYYINDNVSIRVLTVILESIGLISSIQSIS